MEDYDLYRSEDGFIETNSSEDGFYLHDSRHPKRSMRFRLIIKYQREANFIKKFYTLNYK